MSWVMKITVRSSTGSIQKAVLAAPPHANSPGEPRICARAGDCITEEAEPEAYAPVGRLREHAGLGEVGQVLTAREMIHGHELHRLAPEEPDAVELTQVLHHRGEAEVVRRRGEKTAAPGEEAALPVAALVGIIDHL